VVLASTVIALETEAEAVVSVTAVVLEYAGFTKPSLLYNATE
jgi:hypothetical protein